MCEARNKTITLLTSAMFINMSSYTYSYTDLPVSKVARFYWNIESIFEAFD